MTLNQRTIFSRIAYLISLMTVTVPLIAAERINHFELPAQPLADSLNQFSDLTGIQVFFSAKRIQKFDAAPLSGDYTPEQALSELLIPSGLNYRFAQEDAVIVNGAKRKGLSAEHMLAMSPTENVMYAEADHDEMPKDEAEDPVTMDEMTVTAYSYLERETTQGERI